MKNQSLYSKVILVSLAVTLIISLLLGFNLYVTQVKPVESEVKSKLEEQMQAYINSKIDLKIQGGIIGSAMLSLNEKVKEAVITGNTDEIYPILKSVKADYAKKTNFQGVFIEVIRANGDSLLRSWNLDQPAGNRLSDPLIKRVFSTKKAEGALIFGQRGVSIVSVTPIMDGDEFLGVTTMVLGVGSISRDFAKEYEASNGKWIMLVDKNYVLQKLGTTKAVDNLKAITDHYVIANNKWFSDDVVQMTRDVAIPMTGDHIASYVNKGQYIIDLPAYDEKGEVFGRQIFMQDESVFSNQIDAAISHAWWTLFEIIAAVLILSVILTLLIKRIVITPLEKLRNNILEIERTGDFTLKTQLNQQDEVGQTADAINQHLEKVNTAIAEANKVIGALAKGNLNERMRQDYKGSLLQLKNGINQSTENVTRVIEEISQVMNNLNKGQFHVEVKQNAQGTFAVILANTSEAMDSLDKSITNINQVMQQVALGEFSQRISVQTKGELATLTKGINDTVTTLDEVISNVSEVMIAQSHGDLTQRATVTCHGQLQELKDSINANANHLEKVIQETLIASNTVSTAAEEVSRGSSSLSDSVQQQAASMEQTSASMKEMNDAITRNANNTIKVDSLEKQLQENSETASVVMHDTIQAMNEIQESSQKINEIVSMIDSIAFQTNLLALNAAVEAARAGEQGRGFAVVAGEVRALAGKSAEAAKEIAQLITESVESINKGTELASKSETVLQQMNDSIGEVTQMISDIASTSSGQARGVTEVNQAINLIDEVTQNNAALVEETSAAAESLKDQASQLRETVRFFKTSQSAATQVPYALPR